MKTYLKLLLVIALGVSNITESYSQETVIESKIIDVTVFQQGAQIYRKSNTSIKKGHQIIRLSNLSNNIDVSSIQVNGKGKFTIMSVTHQINYLKQIDRNKRIIVLIDSIAMLKDKISQKDQIIRAFQEEINLLKANQSLKANGANLKVAEIKMAADFYRARFREIYYEEGELKKQQVKLQSEMTKIQQTLNVIQRNRAPKGVGEILVEIESQLASKIIINFNYLVSNAGWIPQYDIRAIDIKSDIELHYRANIYQNTGVDWNNIKLTVSTGNPRQNGIMPVIRPWYLSIRNPNAYIMGVSISEDEAYDTESVAVRSKSKALKSNVLNSANFTTVKTGQTNTKFEISLPYSIPSTNKKVSVKIQKWLLPADYRYYCAPRMSEDVFLQARIAGWEELNLLAGNVNIFFDGTYVSKSYINPMAVSDTLDISLGVDKNIIVKRTKVKDSSSKSIMGKNKKMNVAWNIVVRNNKTQEINLFLQDQIPLSYQEDVFIKLNEKSDADYNEKTGYLGWKLELPARNKKVIKYDYQIKYPKDLSISGVW